MSKGWFVTGSSRGLGRVWVEAALERGDRVVATARDVRALDDLVARYGAAILPLPLDVTDKDAAIDSMARAHDFLGSLDVVVNNAGYGLFGMVEEVSEEQARAQLETNVFGALWVTQAALPYLREQGSGHILQVSSIGGVHAFPGLGLYHASKWALEGFSQSLAQEMRPFGIHVTLIEPTGYSTDWAFGSAVRAEPIAAYDELRESMLQARAKVVADRGNPTATADAVLAIVDMDEPPLRLFLGKGPLDMIRVEYAQRLETWEAFDELSRAAHGTSPS
ncbi:MAG: SDR family oxidoreductase [Actinobacteria bacterium]|nr:SDR family oxidoreductase [Actinomycetota bacterium]